MKIKILKLQPNSRFHFGKPLIDSNTSLTDTDTYLHSDVLFSALVNNLASVKGKQEVDGFVKAFEEGIIKISSCFYCLEALDKSYSLLLPKPANAVNQVSMDNYDAIKKVKKIQFVDTELLDRNVNEWKVDGNIALSSETLAKLNLRYQEKNGHIASEIYGVSNEKKEHRIKLFTKKLNTQVGIRSTKEEAYMDNNKEVTRIVSKGPYQVSYIQIADLSEINLQVHFYFLYEINDSTLKESFELAVELLKYNGVGGERSSGYGKIDSIDTLESIPSTFLSKTNTSYYLSLSKIVPENPNELASFKAYNHTIRGGRQTHDEGMLQSIRMINEGAITSSSIKGKIVDISPSQSYNYIRYGKAFLLPLPNTFSIE